MALAEPVMMEMLVGELVGPPLPPVAARAWEAFGKLSRKRSSGMSGIGAITDEAILAYQVLRGITLTALDVELIDEADTVFLEYAFARMKSAGDQTPTDATNLEE